MFNILEFLGFAFLVIVVYFAFMWTIGKIQFKTETVTLVERDGEFKRLGTFTELVAAVQALAAYNPPRDSSEGILLADLVEAVDKYKRAKVAKIIAERDKQSG